LVKPGAVDLDLDVLSRWMLVEEPRDIHETPYAGIRCRMTEALPAVDRDLEPPPRALEDAAGALRRVLESTVARTIGSARRVAVLTGGGVDSSALLALAAREMRARGGSAFAVALDYRADGDDGPHLEALEQHLGCEVIRVAPEEAAHRANLLYGIDAAPFGSPMGPLEVELMARARAHGADLVLTGNGGDDIFDGVPHALAQLTRAGRPIAALRAVRALRGFELPKNRLFEWAVRPVLTPLVPRALRMWKARRARPRPSPWAGRRLRRSIESSWSSKLDELDARLASRARAPEETAPSEPMRVWIGWHRHQQEVASGIERCDPYFDRKLVAWVHCLPAVWLLKGDVRRGLFREAIRGLVPESLRTRNDKAWFEPAVFRFVESAGGFMSLEPLARVPRLADLGLVEPGPFKAAFDALAARPIASWEWSKLWPLLSAEAFLAEREGARG
jgi:asparagine synthase (glutamine-hydrolysing)